MRYTIKDLQRDFPDDNACLEWLKDYLYPDGIFCPNDKKITPHHKLKNRRAYSCELCGHHTYPTANTIFHKSSTLLTLWFYAVYLMAQTRAGISAKQLERELGVTYKTAWRMFHQIRKMMGAEDREFTNPTEIDEVYFHPNPQRRSTAKRHNSQIVLGIVEREGSAKARHIRSSGYRSIFPEVFKEVVPGTTVYTDEHQVYSFLDKWGYKH